MVFHRIVGALSSSIPKGGLYAGLERFVGPHKSETFGQDFEFQTLIARLRPCKLIFLGEVHSVPSITQFQYQVIQALTPSAQSTNKNDDNDTQQDGSSRRRKTLHIVMEHFALDMQELLDSFSQGKLTFAELV